MPRFISPEDWKPSSGIVLEDVAEEVVRSDESMSVIAGPGSGKTELLAQRALFLLQTGKCRSPRRILAISFKRDAAKTLKDRVSRRCPPEQARRFDSYTFDAFAKSLVDRFLSLSPEWCRPPRSYAIIFPSKEEWLTFMRGLDAPADLGGAWAAQGVNREEVEKWGPLPLNQPEPKDITAWVALKWWRYCRDGRRPGLTFSMIGRLADAILRHNPDVRRALQLTYSHIFLDEFQDTTRAQYGLTKLAFVGSGAVLTAVGDSKQRIMTWAGAEAAVFNWFERVFNAKRMKMQINHRSNRRIVQIVDDLAKAIEPQALDTICARKDDPVPDDAAAFWQFANDDAEAYALAEFIARDIAANSENGRSPDDFALLVRLRANELEARLLAPFAQKGLRLRNEARSIEGIAIQDLVVDELVLLLLGIMKLALGVRGEEVYMPVQEALGGLLGTDYENPRDIRRFEAKLRKVVEIGKAMRVAAPADTNFDSLISSLVEELGAGAIRRTFPQYEDPGLLNKIQKSFAVFLAECSRSAPTWPMLIDSVEGKGQVRLMTIHKSKGLEYHTVIFVGLHHNALFGYRQNKAEETNVFFVALSRARERVYFTRSIQSGRTTEIQELVDILLEANVPIIRH